MTTAPATLLTDTQRSEALARLPRWHRVSERDAIHRSIRFADFNAGRYASRNAAFQNAVSVATGIPLDLDGDLIRYRKSKGSGKVSATETAVLTLADKLAMTPGEIHRGLSDAHRLRFEDSTLYTRVFELADKRNGKPLPRATLPRIRLHSPKITRKLTTEWFATRVNRRYNRCMAKAK